MYVCMYEPYEIPVTYFSERFSEIILGNCVNDSCQKEKPSRSKPEVPKGGINLS